MIMTTLQKIEFILISIAAAAFCILTVILSVRLRRERRESAKRIKALEKEVRFDYLTGALSRKAFVSEMETALAQSGTGVLIAFDINGFKSVNEMFGHAAGDGLIKRYAAKLLKEFGKDIVGRFEGDNFLVFIDSRITKEDLNSRIKRSGAARFSDKPTKLMISSCCGAAFAPENGTTFDDLFTNADKALYHSKQNDRTISYCQLSGDN